MDAVSPPSGTLPPANVDPHAQLREVSRKLEAQFLAQMFKSAGLNEVSEFGGGVGEDQFRSFLSEAQAEQVVRAGGVGLAEAIFQSLVERDQ